MSLFGCSIQHVLFDPTLHVVGRNDVVVTAEDTVILLAVSGSQIVEYHDGGHFVPIKTRWLTLFSDYLDHPEVLLPYPRQITSQQRVDTVQSSDEEARCEGLCTPEEIWRDIVCRDSYPLHPTVVIDLSTDAAQSLAYHNLPDLCTACMISMS